eukprot:COSAG02_NODE_61274_length_269_cov_0.605882_1_plen_71_part_01
MQCCIPFLRVRRTGIRVQYSVLISSSTGTPARPDFIDLFLPNARDRARITVITHQRETDHSASAKSPWTPN